MRPCRHDAVVSSGGWLGRHFAKPHTCLTSDGALRILTELGPKCLGLGCVAGRCVCSCSQCQVALTIGVESCDLGGRLVLYRGFLELLELLEPAGHDHVNRGAVKLVRANVAGLRLELVD